MKLTIGGVALVLVGAVVAWCVASCSVDPTVAQPHQERDLKVEEIRRMLTGGDFKQKLEAQKQIDKLEPEEKLRILLSLAKDADAAVRLIAVKKLKPIDDPRAKETLARLAKDDPDETVREQAAKP